MNKEDLIEFIQDSLAEAEVQYLDGDPILAYEMVKKDFKKLITLIRNEIKQINKD